MLQQIMVSDKSNPNPTLSRQHLSVDKTPLIVRNVIVWLWVVPVHHGSVRQWGKTDPSDTT